MEKEDRTSTVREVSSGEWREVEQPTHASRMSEEDLGWSYSDSLLPWSLGHVSSARRNGVPLSQPQPYNTFERATRPATSNLFHHINQPCPHRKTNLVDGEATANSI